MKPNWIMVRHEDKKNPRDERQVTWQELRFPVNALRNASGYPYDVYYKHNTYHIHNSDSEFVHYRLVEKEK